MRIALSVAALLVVIAPSVTASNPRLRGTSAKEVRLIEDLLARSPTARALLARIEATDVIAYVQLAPDLPAGRAATRFVVATESGRFLRVVIGAMTNPVDRPALLAHEMQHVVEIAMSSDVRDNATLRALYARIGEDRSARSAFETSAARDVGSRVTRELAQRTSAPRSTETAGTAGQ